MANKKSAGSIPPLPMGAPARFRLPRGAIPSPRQHLAAATPFRAKGQTPTTFLYKPNTLAFWGNNQYGDCVTAEEAFAKSCHAPEILISDQEAISWATRHNFLNGAVITSVLNTMSADGFKQNNQTYDDGKYNSVDWTDDSLLQNAILVGPVKTGIAADQIEKVYTYGASGWFATGFHPDTAEDHCVALCGYGSMAWLAQQLSAALPSDVDGNKPGYAMFTWATIGIIDVPSMRAITHEAWIRNPTTIIK